LTLILMLILKLKIDFKNDYLYKINFDILM